MGMGAFAAEFMENLSRGARAALPGSGVAATMNIKQETDADGTQTTRTKQIFCVKTLDSDRHFKVHVSLSSS